MTIDSAWLIPPSATVREALEAITKNRHQAVMVVEASGRLAGIVTDGDTRRGLLRGVSIAAPVTDVMNPQPTTALVSIRRDEALALMQRRHLRHLPIVESDGRLVEVLLLDDLLHPAALPNVAVVMAGGYGMRLRPLTDSAPKPLLSVGGKPLLEILVERLRAAGVQEIFFTVHYKSEMIEDHFGDGARLGVRIRYVREETPLGTAGGLALLPTALAAPFFLVNGDILTKCDFRAMLDFHRRWRADLTVGTVPHTVEVPYGVLEVEGEQLSTISEKPRLDFLINSGVYIVDPAALTLIPRGQPFDAPQLVPLLKQAGRTVVAFPIREYWLDVGRLTDFTQANRDVAEGLLE
jgi:dTDP-glucose pyrophosphorylase